MTRLCNLSVINLFLVLLPLTDNLLWFEIHPKQECLVGNYHLQIIYWVIQIEWSTSIRLSVNGNLRDV